MKHQKGLEVHTVRATQIELICLERNTKKTSIRTPGIFADSPLGVWWESAPGATLPSYSSQVLRDRQRVEQVVGKELGGPSRSVCGLALTSQNAVSFEYMTRKAQNNAAENTSPETARYPHLRPSHSMRQGIARFTWNLCWAIFYRLSPRPLHGWRSMLLRLFGANMGRHCHFYPSSRVWAPWNLTCADQVTAGDGTEIYNPAPVRLGSHAVLSQNSYLCGATYDYDDPRCPLRAYTMTVGSYAWVCARACIEPGVNVGEGAVLGLASVARQDLEPWSVYAGVPAVKVKDRKWLQNEGRDGKQGNEQR